MVNFVQISKFFVFIGSLVITEGRQVIRYTTLMCCVTVTGDANKHFINFFIIHMLSTASVVQDVS